MNIPLDINTDPIIAYCEALFDGKVIFGLNKLLTVTPQVTPDVELKLNFLIDDICWIAAVNGDPHNMSELAFANNGTKNILAMLTSQEFDSSMSRLKQLSIFQTQIKIQKNKTDAPKLLPLSDDIIIGTVWTLIQRLNLVDILKQYARSKLINIYNRTYHDSNH